MIFGNVLVKTVKAIDGSNITTTFELCILSTCLTPNTKDQFIALVTILFTMVEQILVLLQNTLVSRITAENNMTHSLTE